MAHYLFNEVGVDAATGAGFLRAGMWGVGDGEPHRDALAAGDLVLLYLGAPAHGFIGRAELASAVHDWTPSESQAYRGDSPGGVLLARVEEWDPPVPMDTVLAQIDSPIARGDFDVGVVLVTAGEYETALRVAAERR